LIEFGSTVSVIEPPHLLDEFASRGAAENSKTERTLCLGRGGRGGVCVCVCEVVGSSSIVKNVWLWMYISPRPLPHTDLYRIDPFVKIFARPKLPGCRINAAPLLLSDERPPFESAVLARFEYHLRFSLSVPTLRVVGPQAALPRQHAPAAAVEERRHTVAADPSPRRVDLRRLAAVKIPVAPVPRLPRADDRKCHRLAWVPATLFSRDTHTR
jgi:hypothetical protein